MTTAEQQAASDLAKTLAPFCVRRMQQGQETDAAIHGAMQDWIDRLQEMAEGQTDRAKMFRDAIWDRVVAEEHPEWMTGAGVDDALTALLGV